MMLKTHLAIGVAGALFLVPHVNNKILFLVFVLLATVAPDIDMAHSYAGRKWYFRPLQLFSVHRGFFHSFTFCFLLGLILAFFAPILALPVFYAYGLHLLSDSFTLEGIRPFWPFRDEIKGKIHVGGAVEETVFVLFCVFGVVLLVGLFF
jgi:membrane-bound metal-dependent hydrolase YbcI (DUF457 family)